MSAYTCPTCHRVIVIESRGGEHPSPGDHDPAYHVAGAYHIERHADRTCASCGEPFPCATRQEYA